MSLLLRCLSSLDYVPLPLNLIVHISAFRPISWQRFLSFTFSVSFALLFRRFIVVVVFAVFVFFAFWFRLADDVEKCR